jgi:hypothetical protein
MYHTSLGHALPLQTAANLAAPETDMPLSAHPSSD